MSGVWRHPISESSRDHSVPIPEDEYLRRANDHLALEAARWHGAFEGLAAREQELLSEIERLRYIAEKNLPLISAHIDKHPDVAKRMVDEVKKWLTEEPKEVE